MSLDPKTVGTDALYVPSASVRCGRCQARPAQGPIAAFQTKNGNTQYHCVDRNACDGRVLVRCSRCRLAGGIPTIESYQTKAGNTRYRCVDREACDDRIGEHEKVVDDVWRWEFDVPSKGQLRQISPSQARRYLDRLERTRTLLLTRAAPCGHEECKASAEMYQDCHRAKKGLEALPPKNGSSG